MYSAVYNACIFRDYELRFTKKMTDTDECMHAICENTLKRAAVTTTRGAFVKSIVQKRETIEWNTSVQLFMRKVKEIKDIFMFALTRWSMTLGSHIRDDNYASALWFATTRLRALCRFRKTVRMVLVALSWYRCTNERLYAPGGEGYLASKNEFDALVVEGRKS